MNYNEIINLLKKYNLSPDKNFGQNFLIDNNIILQIASCAKGKNVIEIGPGLGSLTNELVKVAKKVLCYEIDDKLKPILQNNLSDCNNVEIIFKDFLKANVFEDIRKYDYRKLYVVANLPYYITTPIIIKFIEDEVPVDKLVVMVQKEVGDRFKATPNTKDYNSLSIYLNYY